MPLLVNLRHLEEDSLELKGALPASELELDLRDDMIRTDKPLDYEIQVQKLEDGLLVQGSLHLPLSCQCVRCLKPFTYELRLEPWTVHLPLEGEDKVEISGDFVDLTPYMREDILLEFPQHPLCEADCRGLPKTDSGKLNTSDSTEQMEVPSAWAELDKLKL